MGVVGIDLGTTYTVVASVRAGGVNVLADEQGRRLLPSVVSFHPNGEVLVGQAAKERRAVDAKNTVASVKRLIGRSWKSEEIAKARSRFPFEMKEGPGHAPLIVTRAGEFTLPEISAFVLRRAKQIGEKALGEAVERAVITVPANFNELQRASTKVAGRVAGLDVMRILNEPTAAALAYGLGRGGHERVAIYDFGGGTFDCTLLDLSGNVFEVLATSGDSFLGGDDIDLAIAERMAESFLLQHRFDARQDPQAFERLRVAAEQLKIDLSSQEQAKVHLRELAFGVGGAHLDLQFGMARSELEALSEPFIERTFKVCQDALALAGLDVGGFDKVILVGGSTRIPAVRRRVEAFFAQPPLDRLNPEEVVGIGAAIQAAALTDVARRRSIPPPPAPGQRATTLRGVGRASQPDPDEVTATAPQPIGKMSLKSTQRMANAPPLPLRARAPSKVAPEEAAPPKAGSDLETTRRVASPVADLAASYEKLPVTQPAAPPPRDPTTVLASTLPIVTPREEEPRTLPGEQLADLATTLAEEKLETAPGHDAPTLTAPRIERPNLARTMPMQSAMAPPTPPPQPPLPTPGTPTPFVPIAPGARDFPSSFPAAARPLTISVPPGPAPLLIDVTPRALVVETVGGFCDVVVPRNAKIPCEKTRVFATTTDGQTVVRVRVAQGENEHFGGNVYLGELELAGLRPARRGEVAIAVTFGVDANGTLQVRAADVATGREARATLQLVGIGTEESIARMVDRMGGRA